MIAAGDRCALEQELLSAKAWFGRSLEAPVTSWYEAGRVGFWLHRWLLAHGVANVVVDSSSIEVHRKARRAKTDRLDVRKLLTLLLRWSGGETKAWSVVHVPTPAAEDDRQLTRELEAVREDRTRVRNRIHGLVAVQGVRLSLRSPVRACIDADRDRRWATVSAGAPRAAAA
jgi:transposase